MQPQTLVPYGSRVRLLEDFIFEDELDLQPGDSIEFGNGLTTIHRTEPRLTTPTVPQGTEGTVGEGPYSGGCFDYRVECPVIWDFKHPMIPETLGIPWRLIEFV